MLSVKIPEKMLSEIDEVSERIGHNSRSDFVKTAIRFYLQMIHEKEVWEKENQADTPPAEIEKIKTM